MTRMPSFLQLCFALPLFWLGCDQVDRQADTRQENIVNAQRETRTTPSAKEILGNPHYLAFSYGGYRGSSRDQVPTVDQLKSDMQILSAMGVKLLRTYNTQQFKHAENLLEAIQQLRNSDPEFEMYVMLGAWIDCEGAWSDAVNHEAENIENNTAEINAAIQLTKKYPDIVKMIAVGNESMVHWATYYFVRPAIILKWVNHLQALKASGELPAEVWITTSDNFAAWGGDDVTYHTQDLTDLIKAVDFVSLHTYPFHDSYYSPDFWIAPAEEESLTPKAKADAAMQRAAAYAIAQYQRTADYIESLGIQKPIHIGETGWASMANSSYGQTGSQAADEYKAKLFYDAMRTWTNKAGMSCFYFEAFDERWKDPGNPGGSENHFGLFNLDGQAKYALWSQVDAGVFDGLTRNGKPISKTFAGDESALLSSILPVPSVSDLGSLAISTVNKTRTTGETVTEHTYIVVHESMVPDQSNNLTYPSESLKLNVWEGTCGMERSSDGVIRILTGTGSWWGCALEIQADGKGEDLSKFKDGHLHFEIKGKTRAEFQLGFQTGVFAAGTQTNNFVSFGPQQEYRLSETWASYSIPVTKLSKGANLEDVTGIFFLRADSGLDGQLIDIRNVFYSQD